MQRETHQPTLLPLLARFMTPFRRAVGFAFDTQAFLNDRAYAQIIILQALECEDPQVQRLAEQLAVHMSLSTAGVPDVVRPPEHDQPSQQETHQMDTRLRATFLRNYQGGAR
jgi:hypothetical protein